MAKNTVLFLFLFFVSFNGFAQKAGFGIKAGANMAVLSGTINKGADFKPGPHFGLFGDFRLAKAFALQPEVVYSAQGSSNEFPGGKTTTHLNYLNIPIMAKVYLGEKFYLQTGPQLGLLLSAREKGKPFSIQGSSTQNNIDIDEDTKQLYNSPEISLCFGLGLDISSRFNFSARYNLGLTNLDNDPKTKVFREKENLDPLTNRVLQFSFGLKLGKVE